MHRVITAADVPGERYVGLIEKDWPIFVAIGEETRCIGDVIAIVVADTQRLAREAAEQIVVELRRAVPVTDPDEAPEAGRAEDSSQGQPALQVGDRARQRREGVRRVGPRRRRHVRTQRIEHMFLEPESCIAVPIDDGERQVVGAIRSTSRSS